MDWHLRFGVAALALVMFRLIWGLVGPRYARFSQFIVSPAKTLAYMRKRGPRMPRQAGHSPLAAWSVIALLCLVAYQSVTGLFANDDIMVQGPLAAFVSSEWSSTLTGWHRLTEKLILALIALHLLAILAYRIRGVRLTRAMVTGDVPSSELMPDTMPAQDNLMTRLVALLLVIVLGAGAWWLITLASQAAPSFS